MKFYISVIENLQNIKKLNFCIVCESIINSNTTDKNIENVSSRFHFDKTNGKYTIKLSESKLDKQLYHLADLIIPESATANIESFLIGDDCITTSIISNVSTLNNNKESNIGYICFGVNYLSSSSSSSSRNNALSNEIQSPSEWILDDSRQISLSCSHCGVQISSNQEINFIRDLPTGLFDSVS